MQVPRLLWMSTDVTDTSQPMIFARLVDEDFGIHQDLFNINPLTDGTNEKVLTDMKL